MAGRTYHVVSTEDKNVSGRAEWIEKYDQIVRDQRVANSGWIAYLRKLGIKAAHPDDGWVDRQQNSVKFAYPHFDDGVKPGDLIVLGYEFDRSNRIVQVDMIKSTGFLSRMKTYFFTELTKGKL